jgi:hypothetical protein
MKSMTSTQRKRVVQHLLGRYQQQLSEPNASEHQETLWDLLCAAHIVGQHVFDLHIQSHLAMLRFAWHHKQLGETFGQLMRLARVPIGHAFQRLPAGNSGRANISAFKPMEVPPKLQSLIAQAMKQPL